VSRIWTGLLSLVAGVLVTVPVCWAQAVGPSEDLLPAATKGFVCITDVHELADHWNKTQLAQLLADPVMEPFGKDLRRQFEESCTRLQERLGLTLEDLKGTLGGQLSVSLIQPAPDQAAVVLLVDVTGHLDQAKALLEKLSENLTQEGAKRKQHQEDGTTVILFDLPKIEGDDRQRQAVYFLRGNLLGASDNEGVIEKILRRVMGQAGKEDRTLAEEPAFRTVMDRCGEHAGPEAVPQIRWFVQPLGYIEAVRAAAPQPTRRKRRKSVLDVYKNQGFSAIGAVGGFVDFTVGHYEVVHRTAIYAPPPHEKSMKMLSFPNNQDHAPQAWIPRDIATYTTFYWDLLRAFDNFGPLFDELVFSGETGIWEDTLQSLKEDPDGPQIDIRKELVAHLGKRVTVITDYELPVTTTSERLLFAVEATDEEAVAVGIKKMMQDDPFVKRREFAGHVIWETVPDEDLEKHKAPRIDIPTLGPQGRLPAQGPPEKDEGLLPHKAATVAHGYLLVASHYDFLVKVLRKADPRTALGRSIDYKEVVARMKGLGAESNCARAFSRTDEEYRPTYDLIRAGTMPESETVLGRLLNVILDSNEKGVVRKPKIDGRKLPEFDVVRRYLGPAGTFITSVQDGWFVVGFMLPKK